MAPGDEVHQVIAWSSIPQTQQQLNYDDCLSSDGLTATLGRSKPVLDVQHLWLEQCGAAWTSSLRAGPFLPDEEVPGEWLLLYGLQRRDIAMPPPSVEVARLSSFDSIQYLKSTFESGYNGWFVLGLERPAGANADCAFRTLRRREADGQTTVLVNHCTSVKSNAQPAPRRVFEIMLRDYRMFPERVGQVDYESTTEVTHHGKSNVATGITHVDVRDSTDPVLPAIETTLKPCRGDQLSLQATASLGRQPDRYHLDLMADVPRAGRAYTFTNKTKESCLVGGSPSVQVPIAPESSGRMTGLGVCRDCADALFGARGPHWIKLEPAQPAHFIVTGKPVYGIHRSPCAFWPKLFLSDPSGITQLDYGLSACGQIDVSAWRDGAYDNDPLNVHDTLAETSFENPPALPDACAREVTPATGRPLMFKPRGEIAFGLSARPSAYRDNAPLAIWAYNSSDKGIGVMTCSDLDGFFMGGFDVLDQSGNRVLTKKEVREEHSLRLGLMSCSRNFAINIPAHSCVHGNLDHPGYDFVKNLGSMYTLPAGRYQVVPRPREGEPRLKTTGLAVEVTP